MSATNGSESKIPITCPVCQQRFSVKVPEGDMINTFRSSGVIATHERLTKCICGQAFLLGVTNAVLSWAWQPVDDSVVAEVEGPLIVVPGLKLAN